MQSKLFKLPLLMLAIVAIMFTSCSKDDEPVDMVEGIWEATSLKENGQETLGTTMQGFMISFGSYDSTGDVSLVTTNMNGDQETETGVYVVSDSGNTVMITVDGKTTSYSSTITESRLTMNGTDTDGDVYEIVATK